MSAGEMGATGGTGESNAGESNAGESITFDASVNQVKTLADGGLRVTLDLPESAIDAATWLMYMKRNETPLRVACVVNDERPEPEQRPKAIK